MIKSTLSTQYICLELRTLGPWNAERCVQNVRSKRVLEKRIREMYLCYIYRYKILIVMCKSPLALYLILAPSRELVCLTLETKMTSPHKICKGPPAPQLPLPENPVDLFDESKSLGTVVVWKEIGTRNGQTTRRSF